MTIEVALSGLSISLFCALVVLILTGLSLISATAIVYGFIKVLVFLLKVMKGGLTDLKETAKALSQTVTTNNLT
jgi:hypothetical protein